MQPRQRSKCSATVAFSAIVPSRRASIRWIRPRGESISSCQSTYVGQVGRQNPQWTQSEVYSRITRRGSPAGRARGGSARRARRLRRLQLGDLVRDVGDARRDSDDGLVESVELRPRGRPARNVLARAPRPGGFVTRPTRPRPTPRRRRAPSHSRAAPRRRAPTLRRARPRGRGGGRRARSAGAASR